MIKQLFKKMLNKVAPQAILVHKEAPVALTNHNALRLLYFYEHLRTIQGITGDVVECGVGWGRSVLALSIAMHALNQKRVIYGFDSFEGFPEPTKEDLPGKAVRGHYKTLQDSVIKHLLNSGLSEEFVASNIRLVPGFFVDSLPVYDGGGIALLHLDVDIYSSYKETLEFFFPKVVAGGIILFDEYQSTEKYPGARKAIDEFFDGRTEKINKSKLLDRYYVVKA
jgi:hypothetical protein